jgi:hypothetical protein
MRHYASTLLVSVGWLVKCLREHVRPCTQLAVTSSPLRTHSAVDDEGMTRKRPSQASSDLEELRGGLRIVSSFVTL